MNCKICESVSPAFGSAVIMDKYSISYYRCPNCGFVQTEEPYWLNEAYSRPINISDTGIMARNIFNANIVSGILKLCFKSDGKFADYGGGYGIFVRIMRDKGFDFYRDDKYCANLFANGFDIADSGANHFELLTAFEVFEHFVSPSEELEKLLQKSDSILFTTEIMPANQFQPSEWWYYGLNHGQHISFYTYNALKYLANKFQLRYLTRNNLHLFSRKNDKALKVKFVLATDFYLSHVIQLMARKASLTCRDSKMFTGKDIV